MCLVRSAVVIVSVNLSKSVKRCVQMRGNERFFGVSHRGVSKTLRVHGQFDFRTQWAYRSAFKFSALTEEYAKIDLQMAGVAGSGPTQGKIRNNSEDFCQLRT